VWDHHFAGGREACFKHAPISPALSAPTVYPFFSVLVVVFGLWRSKLKLQDPILVFFFGFLRWWLVVRFVDG
jgi:hypothetical protein